MRIGLGVPEIFQFQDSDSLNLVQEFGLVQKVCEYWFYQKDPFVKRSYNYV